MLYCAMVLEDPLGGRDHVARARHALVVHHVERDDPGRRGGARVTRRRAGGQARRRASRGRCRRRASCSSSDVMSSCASTRPPKSARLESMPESTKAIDGVESGALRARGLQVARAGQSWSTPTAAGQSSPELKAPGWRAGSLRVLGLRVRLRVEHDRLVGRDHEPGVRARASADRRRRSRPRPRRRSPASCSRCRTCSSVLCARPEPSRLWTITGTDAFGVCVAARCSDGAR